MRLPDFSPPMAADAAQSRPRVLWLSCIAHALHDGYTDMIYALLPVWQAEFGLDFAALAIVRGVYAGTMATLQLPAGRLAERFGSRATLAVGTLLAALGYALAGMSGGCSVCPRRWRFRASGRARSTRSHRRPCRAAMGATREARSVSTTFRAIWGNPRCRQPFRCSRR